MRPVFQQVPAQETVRGAEAQLSPLRPVPDVVVIQHPFQLRAGEIGIRHQAGLFPDHVAAAAAHQVIHNLGCPPALPYNGIPDAFPGLPVPEEGGLPLVRDSDRGDFSRIHPAQLHRFPEAGDLRVQDVPRIMLHPAGLRVMLGKLPVVRGNHLSVFRENHSP